MNNKSIWICLIWNFENENPTNKQLVTLIKILKELKSKYWKINIYWHRDIKPTACPWKNLYDKLPNIRKVLKNSNNVVKNEEKHNKIYKNTILNNKCNYYNIMLKEVPKTFWIFKTYDDWCKTKALINIWLYRFFKKIYKIIFKKDLS